LILAATELTWLIGLFFCIGQPRPECLRIRNQESNYLLMPYFSYPVKDISGTGQNPGVEGAAFKITFGTLKK